MLQHHLLSILLMSLAETPDALGLMSRREVLASSLATTSPLILAQPMLPSVPAWKAGISRYSNHLPRVVGLGTGGLMTTLSIAIALRIGYRLVDTAAFYCNEKAVGHAIRKEIEATGLKREDFLVTTKVWWTELGFESTLSSVRSSVERLGLGYVDLVLVHWPGRWLSSDLKHNADLRQKTWRALEASQRVGLVKSLGVSNYTIRHLDELLTFCNTPPCVNQIEFHPYNQQQQLVAACQQRDIQIEAYSPFSAGNRRLFQNPILSGIAKKYNASVGQVVLSWMLQKGIVPIPKSTSQSRLLDNFSAPNAVPKMQSRELEDINSLDEGRFTDPTAGFLGGVGLLDPSRIA